MDSQLPEFESHSLSAIKKDCHVPYKDSVATLRKTRQRAMKFVLLMSPGVLKDKHLFGRVYHNFCSELLWSGREHGRGTRRDFTPQGSRTPSPHIEREYRSEQQSPSPRGRGRSPSRSQSYSPRQ